MSDQRNEEWRGRTAFALAIFAGLCLLACVLAALVGILTQLNPLGQGAYTWLTATFGALLGGVFVWATGRARRRNGGRREDE